MNPFDSTLETPQRPSNLRANQFDDKPLWNHVKVLTVAVSGCGNQIWSCNYCNKKVTGSYTKVKTHLLKFPNQGVECCKVITYNIHQSIKREHEQVERKKLQDEVNERKMAEYVSLPSDSDLLQQKRKKKIGELGPLEKTFNTAQKDMVDKEAARMFYASALLFNFAKSPYFDSFVELWPIKEYINRKLQPIRDSWRKSGVSIVSDGWSDKQKRPLLNVMGAFVGRAMFIKAIDASGNIKDREYMAATFINAIKQIGSSNVVQIITDNASNYKAAGLSIETRYPHIFWTPCVVHSLNLALKSICDPSEKSPQYAYCKWIADLVSDVENIRNFIVNHGMTLAIYNKYSKLCLLRVANTRFASPIVMSKRLRAVRPTFEKMVMDSDWRIYKDENNEGKSQEVKTCVVNDVWWDNLDYFLSFTEPIHNMLRVAYIDSPVLHLIYDMWDTMIENVKKIVFEHTRG